MMNESYFSSLTVKSFLNIKGSEKDEQINMLIPSTVKFVENKTGLQLDLSNLDDGLAFIISKIIEYFMTKAGLTSYSLSRESSSFSDEIPAYLLSLLEPYIVDGHGNNSSKPIRFISLR